MCAGGHLSWILQQRSLTVEVGLRGGGEEHGLINFIDTEAKCRQLKKFTCKVLCGRCLSVWGPLPSNHSIPLPPYTFVVHVYTVYSFTQGMGGSGERAIQREGQRGNSSQSCKYQHDWLYLQPWALRNTCRKAPIQAIVLDDDILLWWL